MAFYVTLITGVFLVGFSLLEAITGYNPITLESRAAGGSLLQIATFAMPFLVTALFLWVQPATGAKMLTWLGVAMGTWMIVSWKMTMPKKNII